MRIHSLHDYDIDCTLYNMEHASRAIVAMHGFAGDKKSSCIAALANQMAIGNTGLITFDWPGHGDSPADGTSLRITNCLDDLHTVCNYLQKNHNISELYAFATSFGGYLALLYHYKHPDIFQKIVLRSPALQMPFLISDLLSDATRTDGGWITGFERELFVTDEFVKELPQYQINRLYSEKSIPGSIMLIHGDRDDVVPVGDSVAFCREHNLQLRIIHGADHRYKNPGELKQVIDLASVFLA